MGFFFKPMEQLSGKQVADFTLMQMFPWFEPAKQPATKRPRWHAWLTNNSGKPATTCLRIKSQWYQLNNLNEQYKNTAANLELLKQLEQLALSRYTASSVPGRPTPSVAPPVTSPVPQTPANNSMGGMENMGTSPSTASATPGGNTTMSGMGGSMGGGTMGSGSSGSMSDVLRIQIEMAELETTSKLSDRTGKQPKPGSTAC